MKAPILDAVPAELRAREQWVTWAIERRHGRAMKSPCQVDGRHASTTDPATWTSFENAVRALRSSSWFAGVGFVFTERDPFVGVDLDHAVRDDGTREPWATQIVEALNSYTERSVSGSGLHVIVKGAVPSGGNRRGSVEMYDRGRFFVVTGDVIAGTPRTIEERSIEIGAVHATFVARPEPERRPHLRVVGPVDDDLALLRQMFNARNGEQIAQLWHGNFSAYDGDHSRADLALVAHLLWWTHNDLARVDRLFRQSALYREKWDARRGESTYGAITIRRALR